MIRDQRQYGRSESIGREKPGAGGCHPTQLAIGESLHDLLRRMTSERHRAVEAAFSRFDLCDPAGLRGFLLAQAQAVASLEAELGHREVASLLPDWTERRRTGAILADLDRLGAKPPALVPVDLPFPGHSLGALYVLEGSRLGGQVLKRIVASSTDAIVRETVEFLGHQPGPRGWSRFLAVLNAWPRHDESVAHVLVGADRSFALFHNAASAEL